MAPESAMTSGLAKTGSRSGAPQREGACWAPGLPAGWTVEIARVGSGKASITKSAQPFDTTDMNIFRALKRDTAQNRGAVLRVLKRQP